MDGHDKGRDLTTHTYDEATASHIVSAVRNTCFAEFDALRIKLEKLKQEEQA